MACDDVLFEEAEVRTSVNRDQLIVLVVVVICLFEEAEVRTSVNRDQLMYW